MTRVIDAEPVDGGGPKAPSEIGAHLLRLIEETHRQAALQTAMLADLYNLVFFNLRPKTPAVPPNPNAVPVPPTKGAGGVSAADLAAVANALGGLFRR